MISTKKVLDTFLSLVKIDGASGNEKDVAAFIKKRLTELNISVSEDNAGETFGGNSGNLICYYPGIVKDATPILIAAHMDSVEPTKNIKPIIDDGIIKSDGSTILAADDRVGVTAILESLSEIVENNITTGPIYIVFTVAEEIGMYGSKFLKRESLPVELGFVFDSSAKPGDIITIAPSSHYMEIKVIGKAAHAAVQPENGINAIKMASEAITQLENGRVSETCTINFGVINGGKAINVVPSEVIIQADVRSIKEEESKFWREKISTVFNETAEEYKGKCEINIVEKYKSFNLDSDNNVVKIASKGIEDIGLQPNNIQYPGGSDANIINSIGIPCVNLGLGYRNVHSTREYISIENLVKSVELGLSIYKAVLEYKNIVNEVSTET